MVPELIQYFSALAGLCVGSLLINYLLKKKFLTTVYFILYLLYSIFSIFCFNLSFILYYIYI